VSIAVHRTADKLRAAIAAGTITVGQIDKALERGR
jgi:hypothetical protein